MFHIGTVGRQLGKKLRLYAKSAEKRDVKFNVPDRDDYGGYRHNNNSPVSMPGNGMTAL